MTILLILIWLILGVLGTMNIYYTFLKDWYLDFEEDYRLFNNGDNAITSIKWVSPLLIIGGGISFILIVLSSCMTCRRAFTFYFKLPKDLKND